MRDNRKASISGSVQWVKQRVGSLTAHTQLSMKKNNRKSFFFLIVFDQGGGKESYAALVNGSPSELCFYWKRAFSIIKARPNVAFIPVANSIVLS